MIIEILHPPRPSRHDNDQYRVENMQVPQLWKQYIGMAANGLQTWELDSIPFKAIGLLFLGVGTTPFESLYQTLYDMLPHLKKQDPEHKQKPKLPKLKQKQQQQQQQQRRKQKFKFLKQRQKPYVN
jgi:hypothetical protein